MEFFLQGLPEEEPNTTEIRFRHGVDEADSTCDVEKDVLGYVGGYIVKETLKKIGKCATCRNNLCSSFHHKNSFMDMKRIRKNALRNISETLSSCILTAQRIIKGVILQTLAKPKIVGSTVNVVINLVDFDFLPCPHVARLKRDLMERLVRF